MTMSLRQLIASGLLATALLPLAVTAQAGNHGDEHHAPDRERMEERMQEHRQDVYERAGLSDEKQQALNEAHDTFREEMTDVREAHRARMADILDEDEQQALRDAMHEAREAYREGHGKRHHGEAMNDE
ncbi:hypothetical protein LPL18_013340 [Halomonas sp. CUBES01]|uniref:hypothetical protein n=1 Tax=Halomonas sp. CUBES01 TaxID=2897340 RepID=UPI001E5ACC4B|nr:hypothetical protein [Halomonas sp. CUBES01]MEC4768314.1 hypothetical protein [Halomonas sp. CUBES01]